MKPSGVSSAARQLGRPLKHIRRRTVRFTAQRTCYTTPLVSCLCGDAPVRLATGRRLGRLTATGGRTDDAAPLSKRNDLSFKLNKSDSITSGEAIHRGESVTGTRRWQGRTVDWTTCADVRNTYEGRATARPGATPPGTARCAATRSVTPPDSSIIRGLIIRGLKSRTIAELKSRAIAELKRYEDHRFAGRYELGVHGQLLPPAQ